jgi:hypothetical protein
MGSKERMTRIMGVTFGSIAVIVAAFAFAAAEPTSAALDSDLKDVGDKDYKRRRAGIGTLFAPRQANV